MSGLSGTLGGFAKYTDTTQEQERQRIRDMVEERRYQERMAMENERLGLERRRVAIAERPEPIKPDPFADVVPSEQYGPLMPGQIRAPSGLPRASWDKYFGAKAQAQGMPQAPDMTASLDDPTLRMAALNYAKGGGLPTLGFGGKAAEARLKIMGYAAHNFPALDIAANKADLQKNTRALTDLQKLYDASTAFEATAIANANVMEGTLKGIPDTGTRFGNRVSRFLASQMGSPQVSQFYTALETVKPEFARLLTSPGATGGLLTDTSRREMSAVLSGDFTKPQLIHSLNILKRDAANRRTAYSNQIDAIRARLAWNQSGANPNFNIGAQQTGGDTYWTMDANGNLVPTSQ